MENRKLVTPEDIKTALKNVGDDPDADAVMEKPGPHSGGLLAGAGGMVARYTRKYTCL